MQNPEVNCGQSFEVCIKILKKLKWPENYVLTQFL